MKVPHNKLTTTYFINKASLVHANFYDYSKVVYTTSKEKVIITCPIHGDFTQIPNAHLRGVNCPSCGLKTRSEKRKTPKDVFINKANIVHNSAYTYEKTIYVNSHTKVDITCPTHGVFSQVPYQHLNGSGCKQCAYDRNTWNWEGWETAGLQSNSFVGFQFYVLECWNDTEKFYKIGKTFTSISLRYSGQKKLPYNWKIIQLVEGNAEYISNLEKITHTDLKDSLYTPQISFHGSARECFSSYLHIKDN